MYVPRIQASSGSEERCGAGQLPKAMVDFGTCGFLVPQGETEGWETQRLRSGRGGRDAPRKVKGMSSPELEGG